MSVPCIRQVGNQASRLLTMNACDDVHAESSRQFCLLATAATQMLLFSGTWSQTTYRIRKGHTQNVHQSEHDKDLDTYTLGDMFSLPSSHLFLVSSAPRKLHSSPLLTSLTVEGAESSDQSSETKHPAFLQPGTVSIRHQHTYRHLNVQPPAQGCRCPQRPPACFRSTD